ncbi:MAG: hypothetical protein ABI242_03530, partial [Caulobacteraceae bacterium]
MVIDTGAARLRVTGGATLTVETTASTAAADLRLHILGSGMGALCHQRGLLALHAAALAGSGGAVAFVGGSGAGKSTLAALVDGRGGVVLCDDLCVIGFDAAGPVTWPGVARIKLWPDAAALLGLDPATLTRISPAADKLAAPIHGLAGVAARPLGRVYVLDEAEHGAAPRRLGGSEAAGALFAHVYRWPLAVRTGQAQAVFAACVALARTCPVLALPPAHNLAELSARVDALVPSLAKRAEGF